MASLTRNGRRITVPDEEIDYYLGKGWQSPNAPAPLEQDFPEGDPSEDWKSAQLKAYALAHGIDLAGAKTKPEILAALQDSPSAEPAVEPAEPELD